MREQDRNYFSSRAEAELRMAQNAASPEAVKAHYMLAGHYLDRVHGGASSMADLEILLRRR